MTSAASFKAFAAFCSPSLAITLIIIIITIMIMIITISSIWNMD